MFRETVTHADGTTTEFTADEDHARTLLRRGARYGHHIEATRDGGAHVTWTVHRFGRHDGQVLTTGRSIVLTPTTPAGPLTPTVRRDLDLIEHATSARLEQRDEGKVVIAGLWRIPPAATTRLRERGLVAADDTGRVHVTLAARLARLAQDHRTTTSTPRGWFHPADYGIPSAGLNKPGRRAGLLYDGTSLATCSCGALSAWADNRDSARHRGCDHRREVAAAFAAAL